MALILAKWKGDINGSRYTIHESETFSKLSVFWALDRLDDPSQADHVFIHESSFNALGADVSYELEDIGFVDNPDIEDKLEELWNRMANQGKGQKDKSKYIKIKHPRWGLIDQHRAVMQDHLDRKLSRYDVVHHKNNDKHDNRLENLEIMSLSEHTRKHCIEGQWHKRMKGKGNRFKKGHAAGNRLFTTVEAYAIREMFKRSNESAASFSRSLGIPSCALGKILRWQSYV